MVVSRGDEQMVDLDGRPAWHFPRLPDGRYSGEYPADSADAISQLEEAVAHGAGYLVLPSTAFWWLDFYDDLSRHLEEHCETVTANADCRIYRLLQDGSYAADRARIRVTHVPGMTRADGRILSNFLDSFLPLGAPSAVLTAATAHLPAGAHAWQPPQAAVDEPGAAERELEMLADRGIEFFVIPESVFDWLAAHPMLAEALQRSHRLATYQHHICEIYELNTALPPEPATESPSTADQAPSQPPRRQRSLLERIGLRGGQADGR